MKTTIKLISTLYSLLFAVEHYWLTLAIGYILLGVVFCRCMDKIDKDDGVDNSNVDSTIHILAIILWPCCACFYHKELLASWRKQLNQVKRRAAFKIKKSLEGV